MNKEQIAKILYEIGVLLELKGENIFKSRAYYNAAKTLDSIAESLEEIIEGVGLRSLPKIGKDIAEKIETLFYTGTLQYYEDLKNSLPSGLLKLLEVPGLGAKKVKILYEKLSVKDLNDLEQACKNGKVALLAGFGQKTEEKILLGISNLEAYSKRYLWWEANQMAEPILDRLKSFPSVKIAEIAGSLRRKEETVGDLDFIVAAKDPIPVMDAFSKMQEVTEIIAKGTTKTSVRLHNRIQADLRVVPENQFYFALHHFTGSKEHNVAMRGLALKQGYSLSEWGLKKINADAKGKDLSTLENEKALYAHFGLQYIPPELREDMGELEAAKNPNAFSDLVTPEAIKGVFHNHTTESDGKATLEEMVDAAQKKGWEYLGIADHSKSSFQANGLTEERLLRQIEKIQVFNASKKSSVYVFSGIECDILAEGKLDFQDSLLKKLDYVVASVHTAFTNTEEVQTKRIIKAIENPYVTMLGHLTGRLLLKREPYKVNVQKIIDAAIANRVIIEINASPQRLDMSWRYWKNAQEKGLMAVINTDAHAVKHLDFFLNGVYVARKGWLKNQTLLNTKPLKEVQRLLNRKK